MISFSLLSPLPRFIDADGRSNFSSNGSNNTCASSDSSVPQRTVLRLRFGSPSPSMFWSPSSKNNFAWSNLSTQFCKSYPLPFSRKPPSRLCFSVTKNKSEIALPPTNWYYSTFNRTALISDFGFEMQDSSNFKFPILMQSLFDANLRALGLRIVVFILVSNGYEAPNVGF